MSQTFTPPTQAPPFQQWQQFYPNAMPAAGYDNLNEQIYAGVANTNATLKQQFANDIARDNLIAIERNGSAGTSTTERVNAQLATTIERNGANGMSTTERVNSQLASAIERNGAKNAYAIEKTAGDSRLTTVITDAASRQASNDSARDILGAVERTGYTSVNSVKDAHNGLLGAIERNAGESRLTTVTSAAASAATLADTRNGIVDAIHKGSNELLNVTRAMNEDLHTAINTNATESRASISAGFGTALIENQKSISHLNTQILELGRINQIEGLHSKQEICSKMDAQFAVSQIELHKSTALLSAQAMNNFSISQLEQQKSTALLSAQMAEAKYDALKSTTYIADKLASCCCEIKEKMDYIDRDRLRDRVDAANGDTTLLKLLDLTGGFGRGRDRGDHHHRDRSRSRDR